MCATFSITVDVPLSLVRMTLTGFFSPADVARFVEARDAAHRQLRSLPNQHVTLVDIRSMQIQSQEAVQEFQLVMSSPETASRRIAFVVSKSLARIQAQRAAVHRPANYFANVEDAEEWLVAEEAAVN